MLKTILKKLTQVSFAILGSYFLGQFFSILNCQTGVKSYTCNKCAFAAVHKEPLAWHMTKVHNEQKKCPHCDFSSAHVKTVHIHVKTVHKNGKDFKCEHCDKAFLYREAIQ